MRPRGSARGSERPRQATERSGATRTADDAAPSHARYAKPRFLFGKATATLMTMAMVEMSAGATRDGNAPRRIFGVVRAVYARVHTPARFFKLLLSRMENVLANVGAYGCRVGGYIHICLFFSSLTILSSDAMIMHLY